VDEHAYPADTGSTLRYQPAFEALPARHALPAPLTAQSLDCFVGEENTDYDVRWV
jgi:hypothetical protein